jgi:acetyltransferase-like isoleucine patch superfamily enzyme
MTPRDRALDITRSLPGGVVASGVPARVVRLRGERAAQIV